MFFWYVRTAFLLLIIGVASWLPAMSHAELQETICRDVYANHFQKVGARLKDEIGNTISLSTVRKIAVKTQSSALLNAVNATSNFNKSRKSLSLSTGDFFQAALFIETAFQELIAHKHYYLPKQKTDLSVDLEYDPVTQSTFIIPERTASSFLGSGAVKTVYKSILYDREHSEVVARGQQSYIIARELEITKLLQGSPGIFDIKGFGYLKRHSMTGVTIYSKLYNPGAIRHAFKQPIKMSLQEKMQVALNILKGLDSMHKRKIVHRDLNAGNFLIDIPAGKPGNRKIVAVIADLERSNYAKEVAHSKVQGNSTYTPPEGLFLRKMTSGKYYAADVYALGLIFYHLFYEKKPAWQDRSYVQDVPGPLAVRYRELVRRINQATRLRRLQLQAKKEANTISVKEEFERMILRMVNPNPKGRGTAATLCKTMETLVTKINSRGDSCLVK